MADAASLPNGLTGEQYVISGEAWREARLGRCPNHPGGRCSFARHGVYERKTPTGTLIARWYCRESHQTFSLLPDCLAARLPGTLRSLRSLTERWLADLAAPLGFRPHGIVQGHPDFRRPTTPGACRPGG